MNLNTSPKPAQQEIQIYLLIQPPIDISRDTSLCNRYSAQPVLRARPKQQPASNNEHEKGFLSLSDYLK